MAGWARNQRAGAREGIVVGASFPGGDGAGAEAPQGDEGLSRAGIKSAIKHAQARLLERVKAIEPAYVPLFERRYEDQYSLEYVPTSRRPLPLNVHPGKRCGTVFLVSDIKGYGPEGVEASTLYRIVQMIDQYVGHACATRNCDILRQAVDDVSASASAGHNILLLHYHPDHGEKWEPLFQEMGPTQAGNA